ncbi:MAG: response regulator [Planctomycetales bacterium]|nr:response regulator [Planctomycetales bacterium]
MSISILIADDHELVRRGLRRMLSGSEVKIVGEAADGHEAVHQAMQLDVDLVLLDVCMPEGGGLRALSVLQKQCPDLPVLMFSAYDNPSLVARSMALGARGYLLKNVNRDQLLTAIVQAAAGEVLWQPDELRKGASNPAPPRMSLDSADWLSDRELEVLQLLAAGLRNKEIAQQLQVSSETIKEHVHHILRKLSVTDRTQAAIWAVRHELA